MGIQALAEMIAKSKASKSGNYIKPGGKYLWEVINVLVNEGFNGTFYIAEVLCRESVATNENGRDGKPMVPNAAGATASFCVNLTDPKQKSAGGNVKTFIMALFGVEEVEVTAEVIAETCSVVDGKSGRTTKVTPCRGMLIRDETWQKPQKGDSSKDFTYHRWTTVPQTDAEILARTVELDKTHPLNPA